MKQGIAERWVFGWKALTWGSLRSGRIRKLNSFTLFDPDQNRKLSLDRLAEGDRQVVLAAINSQYKLPPPPAISGEITFHYPGFPRRRSVVLNGGGIHHRIGKCTRDYVWSDVQNVHPTRWGPVRTDFRSLLIVLPGNEIEVFVSAENGRDLLGAAPEDINECLHRHVTAEKIDVSIVGEPPKKREHIERALRKEEKERREFTRCIVPSVAALAVLLLWMAFDSGILGALVMTASFAIFFVPVVVFILRFQKGRVRELERALRTCSQGRTISPKHSGVRGIFSAQAR